MKTIKKAMAMVVLAVAAMAVQTAMAASAFTYQGRVTDINGTALTGNHTVEFRLYTEATGGTPLWGRARNVLLDDKGLFNTAISDEGNSLIENSTVSLAQVLANNSNVTLYLGLTVRGSSGEISPRQALLAAPYAIHASDALAASGDFAVEGTTRLRGALEVSGSVTMNGISAQTASLNGDISSAGTVTAAQFVGYGVVPLRSILMWSGSATDVPDGWALCNGQTVNDIKTPDLRGRFLVGYDPQDGDYDTVGETGGEKTHTLTESEMPAHRHNNRCHTMGYTAKFNSDEEVVTYDGHASNGIRNIIGETTGGNQAHENRPPYYTICFIMRVK